MLDASKSLILRAVVHFGSNQSHLLVRHGGGSLNLIDTSGFGLVPDGGEVAWLFGQPWK